MMLLFSYEWFWPFLMTCFWLISYMQVYYPGSVVSLASYLQFQDSLSWIRISVPQFFQPEREERSNLCFVSRSISCKTIGSSVFLSTLNLKNMAFLQLLTSLPPSSTMSLLELSSSSFTFILILSSLLRQFSLRQQTVTLLKQQSSLCSSIQTHDWLCLLKWALMMASCLFSLGYFHFSTTLGQFTRIFRVLPFQQQFSTEQISELAEELRSVFSLPSSNSRQPFMLSSCRSAMRVFGLKEVIGRECEQKPVTSSKASQGTRLLSSMQLLQNLASPFWSIKGQISFWLDRNMISPLSLTNGMFSSTYSFAGMKFLYRLTVNLCRSLLDLFLLGLLSSLLMARLMIQEQSLSAWKRIRLFLSENWFSLMSVGLKLSKSTNFCPGIEDNFFHSISQSSISRLEPILTASMSSTFSSPFSKLLNF